MTEDQPRYDTRPTPLANPHDVEPISQILRRLIDDRGWQHLILQPPPTTSNGSRDRRHGHE